MAADKHHAASNNIINSMDKMLHRIIPFILPHPIQWDQSLCYSSVGSEPGAKRHFSQQAVVSANER